MTDAIDRLKTALADRYTIEHELGSGGMATVYLAQDLKHRRKVAVKVLRSELAAAIGADRFLQEITVTANLHHPHILELYDSGDVDGALYYVMPYVEGESLRDRLNREKQLSVEDAVAIAREVADALSFANSRGVVHRDIKPENILLEAGHAVIADFGIARAVSAPGVRRLTETGLALGTPAYMSPEQAVGTGDLDGRSDLYALGCVLYEMLAGQPPFTGVTAESLIHQHVTVAAPPVTNTRPSVQPALSGAIAKALAKTPADRFATAAEFAQALERPSGAAVTETGVDVEAMRWSYPVRVAGFFGVVAAISLVVVYALMIALGLPDWVFVGAVVLLAIGLPIMLATGHHERQRTVAVATGMHVPTPTGVQRHFTWRKAIMGGGFAFTLLGVSTAGYMAMRALGIGPAGTLISKGILEERDPILLADFRNRTADSTLGMTVTEALRIDLSQSRAVRLVEPDLVFQTLRRMEVEPYTRLDEQLGREVAERVGVEAVVVGEIAPVGGSYVLSARLVAVADGATLLADRAEAADAGELLSAIDRLSRTLREGIGESLKDVRASPPLEQVTTRSLAALRLYTMGNRAQAMEGSEPALALIEQALALDSTFAMAWRNLGMLHRNMGNPTQRDEAASKAYELRERVPLRERYHIEALYYWFVLGDEAKRVSAYEQLLALYPDDWIALNNLGVAYYDGENADHDRAMEYLRRALEVYPNPLTLSVVALTLMQSGRLDEAEATTLRVAAEYPEYASPNSHPEYRLGFVSFLRGDFASALEHLKSWHAALPNRREKANALMGMHWVLALQGRLSEAASYFDQAQLLSAEADPSAHVRRAAWEGMLDVVVQNDSEQGRRRVEAALQRFPLDSLPVLERPYRQLSRFYGLLGSVERAKALADRWIDDPELSATERTRRERNWGYRWAVGTVALQEGRLEEAIRELARASELRGNCITSLRDLGGALERAGQPDSAIVVYRRFLASFRIDLRGWACRPAPDALGRAAILKRPGRAVRGAQRHHEGHRVLQSIR